MEVFTIAGDLTNEIRVWGLGGFLALGLRVGIIIRVLVWRSRSGITLASTLSGLTRSPKRAIHEVLVPSRPSCSINSKETRHRVGAFHPFHEGLPLREASSLALNITKGRTAWNGTKQTSGGPQCVTVRGAYLILN